jgi:acyl-[acyl carrier protein]--UDP-N-acetylglucosamine O-acyltransferase
VKSHAVITGWTELGEDCTVWPFATVGEVPIIFVERRVGASKISSGVIRESFFTPWRLVLRRLLGRL